MTNRQLFLEHVGQTSDFPLMLEIERAKGVYMYEKGGKRYLDLISGIGVSNIGHCHPKVVQAIREQTERYLHLMVYGEFVQSPQVRLAEQLSSTLPDHLHSCFFVNSGSEAVEGALKLAKRYTGRAEIVSFTSAYHGATHGALSVSGDESLKQAFRPLLPGVRHLTFGEESELNHITTATAAVIIETVQGEAGVRTASNAFFRALRDKCTATGTLLIADEIQCGCGRTGTWWAFEQFDFEPDMMVCAKGMGGGMPIGAFISSKEVMSCLKNDPVLGHITTFGGHPVSCAASLATFQVIEEEQLLDEVAEKAALFLEYLQHPAIKEIRNKGYYDNI